MLPVEKKQLQSILNELRGTVEELLLAGLTTASHSSIERLNVAFKEAARLKLLRLGMTLRVTNEEISRFTTGAKEFSARRFALFLSRTWLLVQAMYKALNADDAAALAQLLAIPPAQPVEKLKVVVLGVGKRVVAGASAAFEFRLRALEDAGPIKAGAALVWSHVAAMPKDSDLPPEALLHLEQKQKFKPSLLLERNSVEITRCAIAPQATAPTRLVLTETSTVKPGPAYKDWAQFWQWSPAQAAARLENYRPTPMELDIELQEEVFLHDWAPAAQRSTDDGYDILPLAAAGLPLEARLDRGLSGKPLHAVMTKLAQKKQRPPLFGVVHYEACRLVFQPLTALGKDGPEYLTVSRDKISQAELVKAMKFT